MDNQTNLTHKAPSFEVSIRHDHAGSGAWSIFRSWNGLSNWLQREWLRIIILAAAAFLVRMPALQGERIWDDQYLAHDNPFIKSPLLALEGFRHYLFLDSLSVYYRPVQNISYIIDYFFWNTDTWGFHLTNVLIHAGSGVLLYFLLLQILPSLFLRRPSPVSTVRALKKFRWISVVAFFIALLWVVHPVHSAAIDYISGRADSLAFLFASTAWLLFLRAQRTPQQFLRPALYFLAGVSALLAMFSREIAIGWIVLFVAYLLRFETTTRARTRIATLLCCGLIVAIYIGCRHLPSQRAQPPTDDILSSASVRAMLMARSLGDYGRLMLFPVNLHMERTVFSPLPYRNRADWRNGIGEEYLSILGLFIFVAFVFACIRTGRGQVARIFGAGWFFAAYLPISNLFPLNATVAEHWLYLPSVGFLIFVAGCLIEISPRYWKIVVIPLVLAAAALGVRSYLRSTDWVSAETFYRRTLQSGGTSARTGLNLALIYADREDYAGAEKIIRKVLEVAPDYPIAQNNLASALSHQGKTHEAEALFALLEKNAAEKPNEFPRSWMGAVNLARLRYNAHDINSTIAILDRARNEHPEVWELISFESEVIRKTKGPDAALCLVEDFARRNWWHRDAALALGRLYAQKNDIELADAALRRASWLDIHDTEALRLIAQMRLQQNQLDDAFTAQRRAVARQPDEPRQYVLLSDILERMGRRNEAHAAMAKASSLRSSVQRQSVPN